MNDFKNEDLKQSELYRLFMKLSMQSKSAIVDEEEFDDFKHEMHIHRTIEDQFEEKINESLLTRPKSLLLIVGNVGDGKSHMLSYMTQKYAATFKDKNVRIHNDATETDSPTRTSIQTMLKVLAPYSDRNLGNNRSDRLIVAINLGILTNLMAELEKTNQFNHLLAYIEESKVLEKRQYEELAHKYFDMVSFNAEERFTLNDGKLESRLYQEALNRVFQEDPKNIFYQAYQADQAAGIDSVLHRNYDFVLRDSVKETLVYLLIRAEIEYKEIISVRDLFNFFYDICLPIEGTKEAESYLPYLLFESPQASHLLNLMHLSDPAKSQSRIINELAIELYHAPDTYEEVTQRLAGDSEIFAKVFHAIQGKEKDQSSLKVNFDDYLKTYLRVLFLADHDHIIFNNEIFKSYLALYEQVKNRKNYSELMKLIEHAMERWNGESLKRKYMVKNTSNHHVKLLVDLDLKPDRPLVVDNEIIIPFEVSGQAYDLAIDYQVYHILKKVENGYFLKDEDYQKAVRFDRFVAFYLNHHTLMEVNYLYNLRTHKTYVLEDEYGQLILKEEGEE